jgi:AraC-like DNA-binding protein
MRTHETVYRTRLVGFGRFDALPGEAPFRGTRCIGAHLVAFPREAVTIVHEGGRGPIVADANRVMFYNHRQEYRRAAISPRGDQCVFIAFPEEAVRAATRRHAPSQAESPGAFGALTHGPSDAASYLRAARLFRAAAAGRHSLGDEEEVLLLLDHLVARAWAVRGVAAAAPSDTARHHAELAAAARALLGLRFAEPLSLAEVAAALGTSAFHLARVFRAATGESLHAFRHQLRVRAAAERVLDGEDLTAVALDVGFSSHSHLSTAFRAAFGVPPSRLRLGLRPGHRRGGGQREGGAGVGL